MKTIAIAGASGFIGKALVEYLLHNTNLKIIALSRSARQSDDTKRLEWRKCDLFSMLDIEKAIFDCDQAVYLVHSMLPSAKLAQGNFKDFDLVLADNFARAAQKSKLSHIAYLGAIIPDDPFMSDHLKSRLEVENTLKSSEIKVTSLRAGIIIGPYGSSFRIMRNLVQRLPIMFCPSWTSTQSNPVHFEDILASIKYCLENSDSQGRAYDIGGKQQLSYKEMMRTLSIKLGKSPLFFGVPFFSPGLSKLWVSLITGAPKNLVYPLVSSLKTDMVPDENKKLEIPGHKWKSFEESIELTIKEEKESVMPNAFKYTGADKGNIVRSIQRIINPLRMEAKSVSDYYFRWLPRFFKPFIKVETTGIETTFSFLGIRTPLLILSYSEIRSSSHRQLFYITGGLLAIQEGRGRLEFRNIIDDRITIAAIHDFRPSLPWFIYKYTQALIHLWVMKSFAKFILNKGA